MGETLLEEWPAFHSADPGASGGEAGCGVSLGLKGPSCLTKESEMHFYSAVVTCIPLMRAERKAWSSFPGKCGSFERKHWGGKLASRARPVWAAVPCRSRCCLWPVGRGTPSPEKELGLMDVGGRLPCEMTM